MSLNEMLKKNSRKLPHIETLFYGGKCEGFNNEKSHGILFDGIWVKLELEIVGK